MQRILLNFQIIPNSSSSSSSSVVTGKYEQIGTSELVSMHKVNILEQDEALDELHHSVIRTRKIGEQIGTEATESTVLLSCFFFSFSSP